MEEENKAATMFMCFWLVLIFGMMFWQDSKPQVAPEVPETMTMYQEWGQ